MKLRIWMDALASHHDSVATTIVLILCNDLTNQTLVLLVAMAKLC